MFLKGICKGEGAMKEKIGKIFLYLLGIGLLIYLAVSSIMSLANKKDVHTVTIHEACSVLEIEHSINGLIPTGKDYYYIGIDDYTGNAYLIKGSKKWLDKNFDSSYQSKKNGGLRVKGLVKNVSDFDTERELENRLSQLEGVQYPFGMLGCLEINYKFTAILKLIEFVLLIAVFFVGRYVINAKDTIKPLIIKIWLVALVVTMMLLLVVLR